MASLQTLVSFNNDNGNRPGADLYADAQGNLYGTTITGGSADLGTVFEIARIGSDATGAAIYATSPTTLVNFTGAPDGFSPRGSLITDAQGNLYGTTANGGATNANAGTVFKVTRTGTDAAGAPTYATAPTTLASLGGNAGNGPYDHLYADAQGNLYGTTFQGGTNDAGTVFKVTRTGTDAAGAPTYATTPTALVTFGGNGAGTNGGRPFGSLIADAQGNLYGTTQQGGAFGTGTVFEIKRTGTDATGAAVYDNAPTTLASFGGSSSDGGRPTRSLIADAQGNLYGTTQQGGTANAGAVFRIARTGTDAAGGPTYATTPTTVASFTGSNGVSPTSTLIADAQGNLYGTTDRGGTNNVGTVFQIARTGTDAAGAATYATTPTTLVSFTGTAAGTNGAFPGTALIADAQGNLYGTTEGGGANGNGTVFKITDSGFVVCFTSGTLILTPAGEVAVETLREGDLVFTADGVHRPIRWIGHRTVNVARHPRPEAVQPVRVLAGAFGDGLPRRNLYLSPDHAVCVSVLDPVLIPVKHLINDATIAQVAVERVTYWHVELDSHDILLAEGLPAESFLDTGVRHFFANADSFTNLHPDFHPLSLDAFCCPLVQAGPIVDAVRTRLLARAASMGWSLTDNDGLHLLADGVVIEPERDGAMARFTIPAGTVEARLISRSFVPERVRVGAGDGRRLGVPLRALSVVDGSGIVRSLPIDHPLLSEGYSFVQTHESDAWRWTDGDAGVPARLWAGAAGTVTLCVETAPDRGTVQAWQAPVPVAGEAFAGVAQAA